MSYLVLCINYYRKYRKVVKGGISKIQKRFKERDDRIEASRDKNVGVRQKAAKNPMFNNLNKCLFVNSY